MSTRGRKQRPWRTLRCVVEVKVPPSNRSDEGDLVYHVREALADYQNDRTPFGLIPLPRAHGENYQAVPRIKRWSKVFEQALRTLDAQRIVRLQRAWGFRP